MYEINGLFTSILHIHVHIKILAICSILVNFIGGTGGVVNVAVNKPSYQQYTLGTSYASLANDGDMNHLLAQDCAVIVGPADYYAKWWVNLERNYSISSLIIYNTENTYHGEAFENFDIYIGHDKDDLQSLCAKQTTRLAPGSSQNYTCPSVMYGNFVIIQKTNIGTTSHRLALCEVQVYAVYEAVPKENNVSFKTQKTGQLKSDNDNTNLTIAVLSLGILFGLFAIGIGVILMLCWCTKKRRQTKQENKNTDITRTDTNSQNAYSINKEETLTTIHTDE